MPINHLSFQGLRNLKHFVLEPSPDINVFVGDNGSGKTSLLEGIHILGMGRSFRTRHLRHAISHESDQLLLHARLPSEPLGAPSVPVGIRRHRDASELEIRLASEKVDRLARLVEALPLQLINPDAFRLLEGAPGGRREFIDWGVFHVKHDFMTVWRNFRRALKHRNALLRHDRMDASAFDVWDQELVNWGEALDAMRRDWMQAFDPVFIETLSGLIDLPGLELRYTRGWDRKRELVEVLLQGRGTDRQMGFTQQGPQRADMAVRYCKRPATEVLSRGQLKLVVSALKLAQGRLLEQATGRSCLYLVDDLPAELDAGHRRVFCQWLEKMRCQAFITSVDPEALNGGWQTDTAVSMFHVKHGEIEKR
ncbi:DNA replication/repair protein RecF [Halomonas halocynthiae]|uniref:DNA replication/repair protein RecF n=1 Tax=Halomonas halocynthiae TaxID=176290 RepID=UPI0003FD73B2|nr:DNA replication/repair protein RecF [Halomonas halocynthiae]